ncbi:hypothetical protein RND71_031913 [Anisodus tanguticus]|uniref:Uncharacterized protein n=1 Tax=Anisodus tanguticus TaxID=243964 RepID=A0AAE1RDI3_9SOLA|nr:hypothetical protein RND71_031913 [Anisodus tanguticus]
MDELLPNLKILVKDCGVGPSGASSGYSDSAEKVPDFLILPNTNLVEINDDQITPIAPRRGRPRRPANVKKSPFVPGSGLGELSESPLKSKEKYGSVPIRVTTTYFYFDTTILKLFTKFMTGGSVNHLLDKSTDIMQYIKGFRFLYNTPWTEEDAFAYSSGLHTDGNQGVRGVDENVNDVTLNDGVGGGYSSKEVVGGDIGDGVGGGIDGLPSRYEVLLWHYGRQKQENGERNDFENPGRWRKQARGKKRKKKT